MKKLGIPALIGVALGCVLAVVGIGGHVAMRTVPIRYAALTPTQHALVRAAHRYGPGHGIYVYGGNGPYYFDCSGFVNFVYRQAGINLPARTSFGLWAAHGSRIARVGNIRAGDVVFFVGSDGSAWNPGHVGLAIGNGRFIEYYETGLPAREGTLPGWEYVGAKRWYTPAQVPKRYYDPALYPAKHWHVLIVGSHRFTVTYLPSAGHKRFAAWKRRAIVKWALKEHYRPGTGGDRTKLTIRF
jgi:hypothetical protein